MRILSIALVLGLCGILPATASAAHGKKHHARSAKHSHLKAKASKKARTQHASSERGQLMQPTWS